MVVAGSLPALLNGDSSGQHIQEWERNQFNEAGAYMSSWPWQESSRDIVSDIKDRENSSGYYVHYTKISSAYKIWKSRIIFANPSNQVYLTSSFMTSAEAFIILFQEQDSHRGRGDGAVIFRLNNFQEAQLKGSIGGDIYEFTYEGNLRPEKIIYAGPNPFGGNK